VPEDHNTSGHGGGKPWWVVATGEEEKKKRRAKKGRGRGGREGPQEVGAFYCRPYSLLSRYGRQKAE